MKDFYIGIITSIAITSKTARPLTSKIIETNYL